MIAAYAQSHLLRRPALGPRGRRAARPRAARRLDDGAAAPLALNHHDLWSLRGVGLPRGPAADDPRLRRRGRRRGRQRGHRPLGRSAAPAGAATRRSTRSARCCPSCTRARWPSGSRCRGATSCPSREALSLRGGGVPADGVADRLPDAVRQGRRAARARPCSSRAPAAASPRAAIVLGAPGRAARVGDEPRRGASARAARGARRRRGVRDRRAAARARRRRARDGRRGDLEALAARAQARRDARGLPARRAASTRPPTCTAVLPAAHGPRLDDGHARRSRSSSAARRAGRRPSTASCRWPTRARASPRWPPATVGKVVFTP